MRCALCRGQTITRIDRILRRGAILLGALAFCSCGRARERAPALPITPRADMGVRGEPSKPAEPSISDEPGIRDAMHVPVVVVPSDGSNVFRPGGQVTEPIEVSRTRVNCAQIQNSRPGTVLIEAVISARGTVVAARVMRSLSPELDAAAVEALRQWRYRPATIHGRPVPVYFTVMVNVCD